MAQGEEQGQQYINTDPWCTVEVEGLGGLSCSASRQPRPIPPGLGQVHTVYMEIHSIQLIVGIVEARRAVRT